MESATERAGLDAEPTEDEDGNPLPPSSATLPDGLSPSTIFVLTPDLIQKLLVALGECTEWGRIAILTAIAKYRSQDDKEAEQIIERVTPQFQHANGSVVLSAVKVILIQLRQVRREEFIRSTMRKMAPPLGADDSNSIS